MRTFLVASAMLAVLGATQVASASVRDYQTVDDIRAAQYEPMDAISTALLYPVGDGRPYDTKVLVRSGRNQLPSELQTAANDLASGDEFKIHAALLKLQPFVDDKVAKLKNATGYLVRLHAELGAYDFERHRFPLHLSFETHIAKQSTSLHCAGAYDQIKALRLTSCIKATNWSDNSPAFQYLAVDSEQEAQQIKAMLQNNKAGFLFLMEPSGRPEPVTSEQLKFGSFFEPTMVGAIQPAKVVGLVMLDLSTQRVLISGDMPTRR